MRRILVPLLFIVGCQAIPFLGKNPFLGEVRNTKSIPVLIDQTLRQTIPIRNPFLHGNQHPWYQPRPEQSQNLNTGATFAEAEWVCQKPATGDMMIITSTDVDQQKLGQQTHQPQQPQYPQQQPQYPQQQPQYPQQQPQYPQQQPQYPQQQPQYPQQQPQYPQQQPQYPQQQPQYPQQPQLPEQQNPQQKPVPQYPFEQNKFTPRPHTESENSNDEHLGQIQDVIPKVTTANPGGVGLIDIRMKE